MAPAISARGLVKDYGRTRALHDLDLDVEVGEVFGFIGPNGAGKSTTIRILLDLLRPTAGTVQVLGRAPSDDGPALRSRIGYLPGELALPARMDAGEYLRYLAHLRAGKGLRRIPDLAERLSLDLTRPLHALSKGNKQKVGLVQAFMHEPELLVLDEPTSGLDPLLQREFRLLTQEAHARGATVFLSSHVLQEVEEVAGRVAIIRAGTIVGLDDVRTLRHRAGQDVLLGFDVVVDAAEFDSLPGVSKVAVTTGAAGTTTLTCLLTAPPDVLLRAAARHRVVRWQAQDRELEDLFSDYYRTEGRDTARGTPPTGAHLGAWDERAAGEPSSWGSCAPGPAPSRSGRWPSARWPVRRAARGGVARRPRHGRGGDGDRVRALGRARPRAHPAGAARRRHGPAALRRRVRYVRVRGRRRHRPPCPRSGSGAGLAVTSYMLSYIGPLIGPTAMERASPYSWYIGAEPLRSGFDGSGLGLLAGFATLAVVAGWLRFRGRDLMG